MIPISHHGPRPDPAVRAARAPIVTDRTVAAGLVVALALVALWTVATGTSPADVALVPCPVDAVIGVRCPGCGMTRACVALARGELLDAWTFHPFAFALLPLATWLALAPGGLRRGWSRIGARGRALVLLAAIGGVFANWIARIA